MAVPINASSTLRIHFFCLRACFKKLDSTIFIQMLPAQLVKLNGNLNQSFKSA